jgi:alpha-glucosidase (family GH31 glycosyl hydrolase)
VCTQYLVSVKGPNRCCAACADEPEIYVRWIQFCSLSNVFRVHSDPWNDRRPWAFGNQTGNESASDPESTEAIFRNFSRSRLQLNPMFASAAIKASIDGTPLVQRLDFAYPTALPGATRLDQYLLLGDGMLVAPLNPFVNKTKDWVDPKLPGTFNRSRTVWLPPATVWEVRRPLRPFWRPFG